MRALLLLCLLLLVAGIGSPVRVGAVPPPPAGARHSLPEGALLGLAEDAARLAGAGDRSEPSATPEGALSGLSEEGIGSAAGRLAEPSAPAPAMQEVMPVVADAADGERRQVQLPMHLDLAFMRRVLVEQVFTDDGVAHFDMDSGGCNRLDLSAPVVGFSPATASTPAGLRVRMQAVARIGLSLLGNCTSVSDWSGMVEVLQIPHLLAGGGGFGMGVADSRVLDHDGRPSALGVLWGWVKNSVQPRIGNLAVDLRGALGELRGLLSQVLHTQTASGLAAVLESVQVDDVRAEDAGLRVEMRLTAPAAFAVPPEPALSADELVRFRMAVADLDGFLTFVVKTVAGDTVATDLRDRLLAALIDGRYRLLDAVEQEQHGDAAVRALFVDLWAQLSPVLADLPGTTPGESGLRYLAFIAAGDALRALQALGPGTGLDISAEGLRRMARLIAPGYDGDPLQATDAVDEALRRRFGFEGVLPPPLPPPEPDPDPEGRWSPLDSVLRSAWAATTGDKTAVARPNPVLDALAVRLRDWAPGRADLDDYLPLVRDLLHEVAAVEQHAGKVPVDVQPLYRNLLFAIAWQESCWRQYVREGGQVVVLRSAGGALGLMQVNKNVWRGFYDVDGLARDIAYNARAGAEIARHYLVDLAVAKREQQHAGGMDNLARAAYAAYNGGPAHLGRYRKPDTPARLRAVDKAFLDKYQAVQAGDELAVASCYGV